MATSVAVGSPAPDFAYQNASGESRRLAESWRDGPTLVLWLRHFG